MMVGFSLITTQLLKVVGLLPGGGILLLWVCWNMWRELREPGCEATAEGEAAPEGTIGIEIGAHPKQKTPAGTEERMKVRQSRVKGCSHARPDALKWRCLQTS